MKIKSVLSFAIAFIFLINLASASVYYEFNMYYGNELKIKSYNVVYSQDNLAETYESGNYYEIKDVNSQTIKKGYFYFPLIEIYDNGNGSVLTEGGKINRSDFSFEAYIPYYENAKEIVFYNENKEELARQEVSDFSKQEALIVNNEIENKNISNNQEENNYASFEEIQNQKKRFDYSLVLIIILVIILIGLIFYYFKISVNKLSGNSRFSRR